MTTFEEVALKLNRDILAEAAEQRADVIVTTCPLCQMNLEAYQGRIEQAYQETYDIPILFFTQLRRPGPRVHAPGDAAGSDDRRRAAGSPPG